MIAVLNSFLLVAAAEMGDKTQLLAFVLASRFKKPGSVLLGILAATVLNHILAALFGNWVSQAVPHPYLKWILAITFIGFAGWILLPDKDEDLKDSGRWGAFVTTFVSFFMAEMGDKTQLSTIALAARYQDVLLVTIGTTLGMMLSDGLAVLLGEKITQVIPMVWLRRFSALIFFVFGIAVLVGA